MNKKLLAVAVAGTLLPVGSQSIVAADQHEMSKPNVSLYGRVRLNLRFADDGTDTTANVNNNSSRLGVKADVDVGNGRTVFGRYEFGINTDQGGSQGTRLAYVGISGGFGSISMGSQSDAYDNNIGAHILPWNPSTSNAYANAHDGSSRYARMIKYANDWGGLHLELDAQFITPGGEDERDASLSGADHWAIAATYNAENWLIGGGYKQRKEGGAEGTGRTGPDDRDTWGAAFQFRPADWRLAIGYNQEDDGTSDDTQAVTLLAGTRKGPHQLELGWDYSQDDDNPAVDKRSTYNVEYDYHFNRNARLYFAAVYRDPDSGDATWDIWAPGFRIDF